MQQQRPTGITILAVLAILGGLLGLCGSAALFGLSGLGALSSSGISAGTGILYGLLGLVSSLLYLAFGFGAWTLRPWAWILGIVGAGFSVLSNVLSLVTGNTTFLSALIGVAIAAVILWYLFRPEIKAVFGRS
ncbi:MAG: hypothetical protein WAZ19_17075 [Anaerolineae bacterium]